MLTRTIHTKLGHLAAQFPVVTITGPRQAGKTTLCKMAFPNHAYRSLEDLETRQLAHSDPKGFLKEFKDGVILDEFQRAPELASYIQGIVDGDQRPNQFILTGSEQLTLTQTVTQSLAGRTAVLKLLPFSYQELYGGFDEAPSVEKILFYGFYPRIHDQKLDPYDALSAYVETYIQRDVRTISLLRNLDRFEKFVALCAANIGQLVNYSRFSNDIGVDQETIKSWISVLQATYILYLLPSYQGSLRKRLTKAPKLYFYDVGLAVNLLRVKRQEELANHPLRGALFENYVITDLIKETFNRGERERLYFYRDHTGNEIDLIDDHLTELTIFEIKMGQTIIKEFFKGLEHFKSVSKLPIKRSYLIYGGEEQKEAHDCTVLSHRKLKLV